MLKIKNYILNKKAILYIEEYFETDFKTKVLRIVFTNDRTLHITATLDDIVDGLVD